MMSESPTNKQFCTFKYIDCEFIAKLETILL